MTDKPLCTLGTNCHVDAGVLLGYRTGRDIDVHPTSIGHHALIRSNTVIYTNTTVGDHLETGHNVVIREENTIGDHFSIWNHSTVDYGCVIGNGVRIHNHVYVAQFTTIEDDVFLAPGVVTANDPHPICTKCMQGPTLKRGCRVGVNVTILSHVTIGEGALVGAGSVVTEDIPPHTLAYGNPARPRKHVDELTCPFDVATPYVEGVDVKTRESGQEPVAPPITAPPIPDSHRLPVLPADSHKVGEVAENGLPQTPFFVGGERIIVIIPAYNEEGKIGKTVQQVQHHTSDFVSCIAVVDDGSHDATVAEAQLAGARVISHEKNQGAGAAIRTGIDYGVANGFTLAVVMGGDDQDDPSEMKRLLTPIIQDHFDFVQGSRYLAGGKQVYIPLFRWITTGFYSFLFKTIMRFPISDGTNGYRAFRLSLCENENINLQQDWLNRYELEPYLFYKAIEEGFKVTEAPVTKFYPFGSKDYTKMEPFIGWWSILRPLIYLKLGFRK